jgi:hypothetical protein
VHLEDLHCLLAHFPGLICHHSVFKIIKKIKKNYFLYFIFFISHNFILCFTYKCYFVISVSGLVLHVFT